MLVDAGLEGFEHVSSRRLLALMDQIFTHRVTKNCLELTALFSGKMGPNIEAKDKHNHMVSEQAGAGLHDPERGFAVLSLNFCA